jgi:chromosome partitioning protein
MKNNINHVEVHYFMSAKIISVGTPKGGSGKSTTVETLAVEAAYQGYKVLIYDMDSIGSSTNFVIRRNQLIDNLLEAGEEVIPTVMQVSKSPAEKKIRRSIMNFSNDYDLIFIDNKGEAETGFLETCMIADLVIYPVEKSTKEIEQIPKMIDLIQRANDSRRLVDEDADDISVLTLINKVDLRKREANTAFRKILKTKYSDYFTVASVSYPFRESFMNTDYGTTVSDERSKERGTVQLLLKEVLERVGLKGGING